MGGSHEGGKPKIEREQGRREATEDMSKDLSEGEKGKDGIGEMVQSETPKKNFLSQISNLEVWSDDKKEKRLYVVLLRSDSCFELTFVLTNRQFLRLCQCVNEYLLID